jgi:polycomb protein EED
VGRQVAWSRGGEWCVVVGSVGTMAVFERWEGR